MRMGRAVTADVVGPRRRVRRWRVLVAALDLGFYAVMGAAAGGALVTPGGDRRALAPAGAHPLPGRTGRLAHAAGRSLPLGLALAINAALLPRRHADHLPVPPVSTRSACTRSPTGSWSSRWPWARVFLAASFPLISRYVASDDRRAASGDPGVVGPVRGRRRAAGGGRGACWLPALIELVGRRASSPARPSRCRSCSAAGALAWVNGVFGYALIAKERQASALWLNVSGLVFNVASTSRWCPPTA